MANQTWEADAYASNASFVSELGIPVLDLLNPQTGEMILDLGCGDGTLAKKIQKHGVEVIGTDSSDSMICSAREKGLQAYVEAAENISYINKFDAVFSNAALHWMPDYLAVLTGVYKALKSPGRFVGEFGGSGNIVSLRDAMRDIFEMEGFGEYSDPWYFPTADEYADALNNAGFLVTYIELIPRPTPLSTGVIEWLKIFANHLISRLSQEQAELFLIKVEERVKPTLYTSSQGWVADYVRLRFEAKKV